MGERNRHGEKLEGIRSKQEGHKQEVFSGRSEKIGSKEASQDSRARAWGTSKSLHLVPGTAGSLRGVKKVMLWSPQPIS